MNRRRYSRYHRMRTTQERRMSFACDKKYVRPARNFVNLPNSWDDKHITADTSWKASRKTQYRSGKRGTMHETVIDYSRCCRVYRLKDYFDKYDIPYRIEEIKEQYTIEREIYKTVIVRQVPQYHRKYSWVANGAGKKMLVEIQGKQIGYKTIWGRVPTGEYKTYQYSKTVGFKIIWWSDKDIGINYILNSLHL